MNILVTGGAGFIGTHLVRRLLREGCEVAVLDNFSPQIHGDVRSLPPDISPHVHLHVADIRDKEQLTRALQNQDVVVHLAAETGTGQSMYEVERYASVNIQGTALLMDCLVNKRGSSVRKLLVASSRAIYGEGKYRCQRDGVVYPSPRKAEDMRAGHFEPRCPQCQEACEPLPTSEDSAIRPSSFYGLTKHVQEQMTLLFARTLGLPALALRYQNVYGPGQSLKNPYTGILAIFSNQARANQPINVFEDGRESRDFVYIDDVVEATWRSVNAEGDHVEALNVGCGERTTVSQVVEEIVKFYSSRSEVSVTGSFRKGDIRHNVADLTRARELIGYAPQWSFGRGIVQFLQWAASQEVSASGYESSLEEMRERGLFHE